MWGNMRGWLFSAFIVLVTAAGLFLLNQQGQPTPPTWDEATQAKFLAPIKLQIDPRSLVQVMTKDCDAGDNYRAAIKAYLANPDPYDNFKPVGDDSLEAFAYILDGVACKNMTLLAKAPVAELDYNRDYADPMKAIKAVSTAMGKEGATLIKDKKLDEARKYFEALFSLGVKLWDERLVWAELDQGAMDMGQGIAGLRALAIMDKETARVDAFQAFSDQMGPLYKNVFGPLRSETYKEEIEHPGNIFLLVEKSPERVWRLEGIRSLGWLKFNVGPEGTAADQRNAKHVLDRMAKDAKLDPILKKMAEKARDSTKEDLQAEAEADAARQ